MHIPTLIEKKRDGGTHTPEEITALIHGFTTGTIPDYQMSAWAMAVYWRGMTDEETAHLTHAMLQSGDSFQWPASTPPRVDKHSTGGIGDKTSLVLAPLLACQGTIVPMISGRGLGITGGTLDKLESIPGYQITISPADTIAQCLRIGLAIVGQTKNICPADKKLYALRDVTSTVASQPLIVASIMSKKLAEGLDRLILDVKYGTGAFMTTRPEAEQLAERLTRVGQHMGVHTTALLNPMDQPLGATVGNALEVHEAIRTLQGDGPPDLLELCLTLASQLLDLPPDTFRRHIDDGTAYQRFIAMVTAQHGDPNSLDRLTTIHAAPTIIDLPAPATGTIQSADAKIIGHIAVELGAGRQKITDTIDFRVGFDQIQKIGTHITAGEPLLRIHAATPTAAATAAHALQTAFTIA